MSQGLLVTRGVVHVTGVAGTSVVSHVSQGALVNGEMEVLLLQGG